jgi:hypothetical protein|nr:MAG TPA: Paramyxovirus P/V phosphoprotein C-terminal [Caudoviricetes sp.]
MLIGKFNWENEIDERNRKEEEWQTFKQSLSEVIDKINELVVDINSLTHKYNRLSNRVSNVEGQLKTVIMISSNNNNYKPVIKRSRNKKFNK